MANKPDIIKSYPDESILEELRRAAELAEKPALTRGDFTRLSGMSAQAVARRFGGWRAALERAGLAHMYYGETDETRRQYSDEAMIEEVGRVALLVGKPMLTRTEFKVHSKISVNAVCSRLGPWVKTLNRAGLGENYNIVNHYPDESLLEALRKAAAQVRKPVLTRVDFKRLSGIDSSTVGHRFGTWSRALELAGIADMCLCEGAPSPVPAHQ